MLKTLPYMLLLLTHAVPVFREHHAQKLYNFGHDLLMALIFLSSHERLLPKDLVVTVEIAQIGADGGLMFADSGNIFHDGCQVDAFRVIFAVAIALAGDENEHVGSITLKVRVAELPDLVFGVADQDALLKMGYFVEVVHVELSNKRCKGVVFVEAWQDTFSKLLVVLNNEGRSILGPADKSVCARVLDHARNLF